MGDSARPLAPWRAKAASLAHATYALWLACRDPRVPWYARALAAIVVAYALSPIDLIPDFIPVVGHLDDLVLVPLGLALVIRLIPAEILAEHRAEAARRFSTAGPRSRVGVLLVVLVWLAAALWLVRTFWR